jgi:uncharacterized protein
VSGEPVELDVEIWPTCIAVPAGYRIALTVRGKDYEYPGGAAMVPGVPFPQTGVGPFLHANPENRPPEIFAAKNALHFGDDRQPFVLLPIVPPKEGE